MSTTFTAVPYPYTESVRTNYAFNPRAAITLTGWLGTAGIGGTGTLYRVETAAGQAPVIGSTHHLSWVQGAATSVDVPNVRLGSMPVTAGIIYYASAYVRTSAARSYQAAIRWVDGSDAEVSMSYGTHVAAPVGSGWTRVSVSAIAPAGAAGAYAGAQPAVVGFGSGDWFDVAALIVEATTSLGDYFDGDTSNAGLVGSRHEWAGAAHASASQLSTRTPTAAAVTVTPAMFLSWEDARERRMTVHRIIGTPTPVITESSGGGLDLRSGTFEAWCEDEATAATLVGVLAAPMVMVTAPDRPASAAMYAVTSKARPKGDAQTSRWIVTAEWVETVPQGDAW